ncbi:hypothetical protein HY950_02630 [Candidatus Gottesmanbacteria bacterium]|nr:hypothetical protein [Candidatus Gottesmanbacteria bacterium]
MGARFHYFVVLNRPNGGVDPNGLLEAYSHPQESETTARGIADALQQKETAGKTALRLDQGTDPCSDEALFKVVTVERGAKWTIIGPLRTGERRRIYTHGVNDETHGAPDFDDWMDIEAERLEQTFSSTPDIPT